ncbi:MAG: hypothetical protein ACRD68_02520 [Pyrinomonadaceae bacterium]
MSDGAETRPTLETILERVNTLGGDARREMGALREYLDRRFDALDVRLDRMQAEISDTKSKFHELRADFTELRAALREHSPQLK